MGGIFWGLSPQAPAKGRFALWKPIFYVFMFLRKFKLRKGI